MLLSCYSLIWCHLLGILRTTDIHLDSLSGHNLFEVELQTFLCFVKEYIYNLKNGFYELCIINIYIYIFETRYQSIVWFNCDELYRLSN
jgi:hypothetical protein